ncbi:Short chain dehydrogenases/reductase notP' [Paramyrothecium foliicola]|nr:Short chain dehydrogenases/reductase notP' [Paramyrothecium foliicola]
MKPTTTAMRSTAKSFLRSSVRPSPRTRSIFPAAGLGRLPSTAPLSTTYRRQQASQSTDGAPLIRPGLADKSKTERKQFADYDLAGKVYIVTGGARGLGLTLAEALVEAGGKVYCLDRADHPDHEWDEAMQRVVPEWGGSLTYCQQDVTDTKHLHETIEQVANENQRLDGVIAAAAMQQLCPAMDYTTEDAQRMMSINYTGVLQTASASARMMFKYKCPGSILMIASMSGSVANKGLLSPVYNSSKAAVVQLARNLAMEWSHDREDGTPGIRVNCLSPGHILTPMVLKNFEEVPGLKEKWSRENMLGRLAETHEFKGAALFLLSNASTFMTGSNLTIDGGHTAW